MTRTGGVWRVRWGSVVLKVYDKAGRVLRVEVKVLNTAGLGCGKGLGKLGEQLECVQGMLERFLASLQAAHVAFLDAGQFERWAEPSQRGNRRLAGLDLNKARNRTTGLRPIFSFSNNRDRLLKAVHLASINQLPAMSVGSAAMLNGLSTQVGVTGLGSRGSGDDPLGSQHDMTFAAAGGLREIDALKGLIGQLGPLPFHKTVLLLSNGFTRPPDQLEYWDSMIRSAIGGGVTFYAADVYGLAVCQDDPTTDCVAAHDATATATAMLGYGGSLSTQQGPTSQEHLAPPPGQIGNLGPPTLTARTMEQAHQDDYVRFGVSSANMQAALRELAERTGGFLIANTNNVDQLLSHVMEEVDTHYEIAYPPKSERDDGHFRKIEVKLARAGLRVETRNGYFAVPDPGQPLTPEEMAGLRAQ